MKTRTTPYHPQSDGLIERFNRTLLSMLRTVAFENPFNWESDLRPPSLAYNTSVHPSTGYTPFFLMFGRQGQMPIDLMYGKSPSTSEYASSLRKWLKEAYRRLRTQMSHKLDRQKDIYDEKVHGVPFKQNDLVWFHSTVVPWGCGRKLHHSWTGPFRVVKQLADSEYCLLNIQLRRHWPVVHFNRLKPCPGDIRMPSPVPVQRQTTRSNFPYHLVPTCRMFRTTALSSVILSSPNSFTFYGNSLKIWICDGFIFQEGGMWQCVPKLLWAFTIRRK